MVVGSRSISYSFVYLAAGRLMVGPPVVSGSTASSDCAVLASNTLVPLRSELTETQFDPFEPSSER